MTRQSARELAAKRGGAIVGVGALHLIAVAGLLHMKYAEPDEPVVPAIRVTNFHVQQRLAEPAPDVPVELMEPPPMEIVVPLVQITLPAPPPTAITPPPPPRPAAAPQVVAQEEGPVVLDFNDVDVLRITPPAYPRSAKLARVEGTVLVWVLVDEEGRPKEVRVHKTSGFEQLDRAGCDSVRSWLFKPHKPHGVAMSVQVIVPVNFEITQRMARRDGGRGPPPGGPPDAPHRGDRDH